MIKQCRVLSLSLAILALSVHPPGLFAAGTRAPGESLNWQTSARLRRTLRSVPGTLKVTGSEIEFESPKGFSRRWPYLEIRTLDLFPNHLVIEGYLKRGRHLPGTDRYRFKLDTALPARVAAAISERIGKPVRNAIPLPQAESFAEIPAHHRSAFGGTKSNGVLRFSPAGIDYISPDHDDSRSWQWIEIQTLSNPDAYRFTVFGTRDTYSFDLKQPLERQLFDRLSDLIFEHNLSDSSLYERTRP
jgi:hypothetical protein